MWPYTRPEYKPTDINKAIRQIISGRLQHLPKIFKPLEIVDNWRNAHEYPSEVIRRTLERRARKIDSDALVAKRIKRLAAIITKLERDENSTMRLSQMQDIGGCRAVVRTIHDVEQLVKMYQDYEAKRKYVSSKCIHAFDKYDYIKKPKKDGYRSVHLVYEYRPSFQRKWLASYNGLKVEIQIRTRLQHAWATAIETVDSFTKQGLKVGKGEKDWRRFFQLASTAIAHIEYSPLVEDTPQHLTLLADELNNYKNIINTVRSLGQATEALHKFHGSLKITDEPDSYYVLHLNIVEENVQIYAFASDEIEHAQNKRSEIERSIKEGDLTQQVVMVQAGTIAQIRESYPNYFLDIRYFVTVLEDMIFNQLLNVDVSDFFDGQEAIPDDPWNAL